MLFFVGPMPKTTVRPKGQLVLEAQRVLHKNQRELAEALGVAERTVQRWTAAGGMPSYYLPDLARLVFPVDAGLAAEIAACCGQTLEQVGLQAAAAPSPAPAPTAPPARALGDSVLCAAASAAKLPPEDQRGPLLAALKRAKELGMSVDEAIAALAAKR